MLRFWHQEGKEKENVKHEKVEEEEKRVEEEEEKRVEEEEVSEDNY